MSTKISETEITFSFSFSGGDRKTGALSNENIRVDAICENCKITPEWCTKLSEFVTLNKNMGFDCSEFN